MTSKYQALAEHLARLGAPLIILTFAEIKAIVGPLPAVARMAAWWGATANRGRWYPHTYAWRDAGYATERLDVAAETVTFRRIRS